MKNDAFWRRTTLNNVLLNHLPMNHRRYILERFEILRQGEGLKDLFARFQGEELAELQRRRQQNAFCMPI